MTEALLFEDDDQRDENDHDENDLDDSDSGFIRDQIADGRIEGAFQMMQLCRHVAFLLSVWIFL